MIDVSEVINDPDLAQQFTVLRSSGSWLNGTWQSAQTPVTAYGVISVAEPRDIEMLPEGDVTKELRVFWTTTQIFTTNANSAVDSTGGSSDILVWRGDNYRVLSVSHYEDYGYYRAVATRMLTD